jgi:hypothetical protein
METVMKRSLRRKMGRMARVAGDYGRDGARGDVRGDGPRKEKREAVSAGFCVEGAVSAGGDLPNVGKPMDDPSANRKVQEEVERHL